MKIIDREKIQIEDAWVNVEDNIIDAVEEFCEYLVEKYDLTPIQ